MNSKDVWDLSYLYKNSKEWEKDFEKVIALTKKAKKLKGTLTKSAGSLKNAIVKILDIAKISEKLQNYAYLKLSENVAEEESNVMVSKLNQMLANSSSILSFFEPELLSIDDKTIAEFLKSDVLKDYRIYLDKMLRFKKHTLSESEERILALSSELSHIPSEIFETMTDNDFDFGDVEVKRGLFEKLTHTTFSSFQESQNRQLRRESYLKYYKKFDEFKNTLAKTYASEIKQNMFTAKVRGYKSVLDMALYQDKMPKSVYTNLIKSVENHLPSLHNYYDFSAKHLHIDDFRHYDKYAPIVENVVMYHTYEQALDILEKAFEPLGKEYVSVVMDGLKNGWVHKYESKGKRSGAFSYASYSGKPYILTNFREDAIESVFTLAHEAGHSMHSYYSIKNNPFQHYDYTIFEAEVASTFNERLLFNYLIKKETDKRKKAFLLNKEINRFVSTIFRQTMFAEFEYLIHEEAENGNPTSLELIRAIYKKLLVKYFGNKTILEDVSDLEALRIPHFYNSFYVYKYATGLSAAVALSNKVIEDNSYSKRYIDFLSVGGSLYPLESLKKAGLDMSKPQNIDNALSSFVSTVSELKNILEG